MRCDFASRIEGALMCPTSCLRACANEEIAPLRMVTGVVPATTSPTLKLEQRSISNKTKDDNNLSFVNTCVFCVYQSIGSTREALYVVLGPSHCDWHLLLSWVTLLAL